VCGEMLGIMEVGKPPYGARHPDKSVVNPWLLHGFYSRGVFCDKTADHQSTAHSQVVHTGIKHLATHIFTHQVKALGICSCEHVMQVFLAIVNDAVTAELAYERSLFTRAARANDIVARLFCHLHREWPTPPAAAVISTVS